MTDDDENQQLDNEIVDQDRQVELRKMAGPVLLDLSINRAIRLAAQIHQLENQIIDLRREHGLTMDDDTPTNEPIAIEPNDTTQNALVALGWPHALAKATWDPFFYAVGLRSGIVLYFVEAEVMESGWVRLKDILGHTTPTVVAVSDHAVGHFSFERGLEVRLEEIVWVADAPYGS